MNKHHVIIVIVAVCILLINYFHSENGETRMLISNTELKNFHNKTNKSKHWFPATPIGDWFKLSKHSKLKVNSKKSKHSLEGTNKDTYKQGAIKNDTIFKSGIRKDVKTEMSMKNDTKQKMVLLENKTKSFRQERKRKKNNKNEFTDPSKWTILLTVNNGFYDIFENWWWHFRKLKINVNVKVIAEDDKVFVKLNKTYAIPLLSVERSWILNISSALDFDTSGYKKMVSTRPAYMIKYLEESLNVLYADIDTLFLQNPFQYFTGNFDMWMQSEYHEGNVCSGFMAIKSNTKTINVMREWYSKLSEKLQKNQKALNQILDARKSDLKICYLSEADFVGGPQFSAMTLERRSKVVMLHATFCFGHEEKINCFKKWKLWTYDHTKGVGEN